MFVKRPGGVGIGWNNFVFFLLGAACVALLYLPGLAGGFALDDFANLASTFRFDHGELSWQGVVFTNGSGLLGRPISMLSFVANAELFGVEPRAFKAVNLALHFANGFLLLVLLRTINEQLPTSSRMSNLFCYFLCVFWLAAPSSVSTVLYVVQRMALLSAFFSLLCLIAYLKSRLAFKRGAPMAGYLYALILLPALVAAATYSKENGILTVPLVLALHLLLNRQSSPATPIYRPAALVILLTALGATGWIVAYGVPFSSGYEFRDFTLIERLLSQPRAGLSYAVNLFAPMSTNLGLIQDDFKASTSLVDPWLTLPAALLLICLFAAGLYAVQKQNFWIAFGVAWFFIGHALESTFIPLELYFEHRNYLPGVGLLLAFYGFAAKINFSARHVRGLKAVGALYAILILFVLWSTVQVWSSPQAMLARDISVAPNSLRTISGVLDYSLRSSALGPNNLMLSRAEASLSRKPATLTLWFIVKACALGAPLEPTLLPKLSSLSSLPSITDMSLMESIYDRFRTGTCENGDPGQLGVAFTSWLDSAERRALGHWKPRYYTAMLVAESGDLDRAAKLLVEVWERSNRSAAVGISLFQVNASLGRWQVCRFIVEHLESHNLGYDKKINEAIKAFRDAVESAPASRG